MSLFKLAKLVSSSCFPSGCPDMVGMCVKIVSEKFKIFRSIIRSVSVLVMDDKFHIGLYKMSDYLFHYKTMLRNISHTISVWMIMFQNINISGSFSSPVFSKFSSVFRFKGIHVPIIAFGG